MRQKTSQLLFQYWDQIRGGRFAPQRFEIEPAKIASLLPETFIAEYIGPSRYRFRLAGTRLCEQFGRELRGENLLRPWSASDREALDTLLFTIVNDGGIGVLEFEAVSSDGRIAHFELLVLPLIHIGMSINRLLGSISAIEPPQWLGSLQLTGQRITSIDLVWPDGRPHFLADPTHLADTVMPDAPTAVEARRRFRVLDGGLAGHPK